MYTRTARELRRLDSITKSPMFSLFQEGVAGVAVIRAYGSGALMQARLLERAETNMCVAMLTSRLTAQQLLRSDTRSSPPSPSASLLSSSSRRRS